MATPFTELDLPEIHLYAPAEEIVAASGGAWLARAGRSPVVCGHEEARELLRDRRFHHLLRHLDEVRASEDPALKRRPGSLLSAEGEEHQRLRRLCLPAFKQSTVEALRPWMAATVREHLARVAPTGRAELVADLCEPFPVQTIARILGAPERDWPRFARWATDLLAIFAPDLDDVLPALKASQAEMTAYVEELVARRRRDPADDLLTKLIEAEEAGDRLTTEELVTLAEAILTGGSDTTRNQLAACVHLLLRHDRWSEVADDPSLVPAAVEESLRLLGTVRQTARVAMEDVEHRGVRFPQGTVVVFVLAAANLDRRAFPRGAAYALEAQPAPHVSFGVGIHHCLGAWLARAELEEALRELVRAFPDLRADGEPTWRASRSSFVGPATLPVAFAPRGAGA